MHINFDDEGMIITNLQLFLKENINPSLILSGVWDSFSHESLISYLKKPNTVSVNTLKEELLRKFTYRADHHPFSLVDGGGIINFDNTITPDSLLFYTKPTTTSYENGMLFISEHLDELSEYVQKFGWSVISHSPYGSGNNVNDKLRAEIHIRKTGIINRFPNREVLPMINLFTGKYLYGWCIDDNDNSFQNHMKPHAGYKIAVVSCEAGDCYTIAHGYAVPCEMVFGYTNCTLSELKQGGAVYGVNSRLDGSLNGSIKPGSYEIYQIPKDVECRYMLIQMPYTDALTSLQTQTTKILLGDVNMDGVVDINDYEMLNAYVTAQEQNIPSPVALSDVAKIAANVTRNVDLDGNPIIDREDATTLLSYIQQGKNIGEVEYQSSVRVSSTAQDRLLVMWGDASSQPNLNIPVSQFYASPWAVHRKFIEYFLGRVIHKYSDMRDISWLQSNIRKIYAQYHTNAVGTYDEPNDYTTDEKIIYDNISGRYKYYKGTMYSGYFLKEPNNFQNNVLINDDENKSNVTILESWMYINGVPLNKCVLPDGSIATADASNSLKSLVNDFQLQCNKQLQAGGIPESDRICWTDGNYCVDTDKFMVKALASNTTYITGAFV